MVEYRRDIRSNLIVKSIVTIREIVSRLTDVWRTVKKETSDFGGSASKEVPRTSPT
jgi:predicted MarR family transcription regulator